MKALITFTASLFLLISLSQAQDQHLSYQLYKGDKAVGSLEAWKQTTGENSTYSITNRASLQFLVKLESETSLSTHFQDGKLQASVSRNSRHGQMEQAAGIYWDGETYELFKGGKSKKIYHEGITFTTSQLLFEEPGERMEVFSERHGSFLAIYSIDGETYKLSFPDGTSNFYTYQDGLCREVRMERGPATLHLRLDPNVDQFAEIIE